VADKKTVFMFSGQGSQYFQMGHALYVQDPVFRSWMLRLDGIVQDLSGNSVIEVLYAAERSKGDVFARTMLSHPAIFMVEYSLARSLIEANVVPDITLGTSLGSFAAATLSGFLGVEDALTAVMRQATTFEACCEAGGMIAVLAAPALYEEDFLSKHSEMAGVSFDTHFVVSARQQSLQEMESELEKRQLLYQRLPVSFAFHSQWIEQARAPFESFMRSISCEAGRLPMMCCDQTEILAALPENYFWRIARNAIRFREAIQKLEQQGSYRYIDVGPAGTLATFLKYGLPSTSGSTIHSILTPFGGDLKNLAALLPGKRLNV
jgi:acyl transferase domain-containing protein